MITDLENIRTNPESSKTYDVCIVGAGPAGLILATELSKSGVSVALCEAGGFDYSEQSQNVYSGKRIGSDDYQLDALDVSRLRYLGGSTGHWAGLCRQFLPIDFMRNYIGDGEYLWPISLDDISPYIEKTAKVFHIRPKFVDELEYSTPFSIVEYQGSRGAGGNFRQKFVYEIINSSNIQLFINANLVDISGENRLVTTAEFSNYSGEKINLEAKKFVFAMGGIESPRFMLWLKKKYGARFFNDKTPIGKYWHDHPHTNFIGTFVAREKVKTFFPLAHTIGEKLQRENGTLGCTIVVFSVRDKERKKLIVSEFQSVAPNFAKDELETEDLDDLNIYQMNMVSEQLPSPDNHIELSKTERDQFGIPRTEIYWKLSDVDYKTMKVGFEEFINFNLSANIGRIKPAKFFENFEHNPHGGVEDKLIHNITLGTGNHHMGGLRMFENPDFGVVDSNCKVFGSENLYICGSSIFTMGGTGNPTFSIIQFTLRLADHLKAIL